MVDKNLKKHISYLLKTFDIKEIQYAFVKQFLNKENISLSYLDQLFDKSNQEKFSQVENYFIENKIEIIDLYDLAYSFENLISLKNREKQGIFFTPKNIAEYMTASLFKNFNFNNDFKLLDPSCGNGIFFITSINKLKNKFKVRDLIENNLFGIDYNEYNIECCKLLLKICCLQNNEDISNIKFNIFFEDATNKKFNEKFKNKFDFVIGNPPYIKLQDLDDNVKKYLFDNYITCQIGNFNIFYAFFEIGYDCLKQTGKLSYISPNRYFTNKSGKNLRKFFIDNSCIKSIIDFKHFSVFEVQTYTCITNLNKDNNHSFYYLSVDNVKKLEEINSFNKELNLDKNNIKKSSLSDKIWRLSNKEDFSNVSKLENLPIKLKDLFDVKVGIATCLDKAYLIENIDKEENLSVDYYLKSYKNKEFKIEKNITEIIYKIPKINNLIISNNENNIRIIFPYKLDNKGNFIPYSEEEMKSLFPYCYEYFLNIKEELISRDKGKKEYPTWYSYARQQGLKNIGIKLLTAKYNKQPKFILDLNPKSFFLNGYALFLKEQSNYSIFVLQKILNSKIMGYYISKVSESINGGYFCYQTSSMENFGIPNFNKKELKFLEEETNQNKINQFLCEKYNIFI